MPRTDPYAIHWPTVVKKLRTESNKDRSRAADLTRMGAANGEAVMLQMASLVCQRLALAFEEGHIKAGHKCLPDDEKLDKIRKEGSGKNPPSKRKPANAAQRASMSDKHWNTRKEKTIEATG